MTSPPHGKTAVFLDRDGVLVPDSDGGDLEPYSGVANSVRKFNENGWAVVVVTNQTVVARGWKSEEQVRADNEKLAARLLEQGGRIDAFFYCPHHPEATVERYRLVCDCRKPRPGMFFQARDSLGIDLEKSAMVGDRVTDIEAGIRAGCTLTVLVETGMHDQKRITSVDAPLDAMPDARLEDLKAAAEFLSDRLGASG